MRLDPGTRLSEAQRLLQERLGEVVRFDSYTRYMFSTDASNHQIQPLAVAFPRHEDDLFLLMETAKELGLPILPRGGGTSMSGQVVGEALVIDFSRHMNQIHEIDLEAQTAEVDPGVVCTQLNNIIQSNGLIFGPDPASADRATIGGMIGNNAAGAHSIRYGMTVDHLLAAEVILSDGSTATFTSLTESQALEKTQLNTLEGRIYSEMLRIRKFYSEATRRGWPHTWRCSSGYRLNYLVGFSLSQPPVWYEHPNPYLSETGLNLAQLLCGSEGTLAVIRRATIRLISRPKAAISMLLPFDSVVLACDAVPKILATLPASIELIPRALLEKAHEIPGFSHKLDFLESYPEALLMVEYIGDSLEETRAACIPLAKQGRILCDRSDQEGLMTIRKAGWGVLKRGAKDKKAVPFIEDAAVPVEKLGEYVREVNKILTYYGTHGEWYGHASAGCLHINPILNLKDADDLVRMRSIAEAVLKVVVNLGGAFSGEHGDGHTRSEFTSHLFGPEIAKVFQEIKSSFDPENLLNPGKVIQIRNVQTPTLDSNLRYGPDYKTQSIPTVFAFSKEGDLAHAVEYCIGSGECRSKDGVMCPSYQATHEEMNSTRGRANALREALSGGLPLEALSSQQLFDVLDLCIECKGCKSECPTSVDMARIKSQFLDIYQSKHGVPLRSRIFADIAKISRVARYAAPVINWISGTSFFRGVLERTLGISRHRSLPRFTNQSFRSWFAQHHKMRRGKPVILFVDTYTENNCPEVGIAAVNVLEATGYSVLLAQDQSCCGRPMISKGLLHRAKSMAHHNLDILAPLVQDGINIIGLEPSCLLTLRDEYLEFFPNDPRAEIVANSAFLIEEFLVKTDSDGERPIDRLRLGCPEAPILFHSHCYTKALGDSRAMLEVLQKISPKVAEVDSTCCGMAGSFGYETEHYDLSMQIGELKLLPAIRAVAETDTILSAAGFSCRTQIQDGANVQVCHPIQLVEAALITQNT